jgi:uncharacterized repeat protein (TIGR01451 family)
VQVTDLLPAGLTFVSATPSQGTYDNVSGVWTVGTVSPGGAQTLSIIATVDSPAAQTNSGTISDADQFDPTPANNSASATETPQQADLVVAKQVSNPTPNVGDQITFTVTLSNQGPDASTGVQVTDLLPAGLTLVSATPSQGTYDNVSGVWTVGTVSPGGAQTLSIIATVDSPAAQTNSGTISDADQFDPTPANNSASATETPQQADLSVSKTVSDATPNVGDQITFTVTLSNQGPDAATGVQVTDLLPAGVSFVSANPSQGSYDNASGVWTVGTVGPGVPQTLSITATVVSPAAQTNTGTISDADQFDPTAANNSASATETPQQADQAITKTDGVTTVVPGTSTTYNIVVTNNGPSTAVNSTVIDLFPAAITAANWTAVASPGSSVAVPSGFGNIFSPVTLLPGGFAIFTAVAQISPSATGSLTNTASVFGLTDTNPGNNTATDTDILGAPAIQIVKFVNGEDADMLTGPLVAAGSTVTFTYVVTDTGPVPLSNVVVSDDKLGPITSFTGDTNNNGLLDTTETWTYTATATATALAGQQTNLGTVTALEPNTGTPVTDSNPANYFVPEPTSDDFNGDGNSDVLWRQDGGQVYVWEMNGLQTKGEGRVELVTNDWHIQGVGDFNGDGNSDLLWRQDSGPVYLWEMNGRQIKEEGSPPHAPVPNDWHIEGTGDFDGDFKSDILWRHDSGQVYLWEMDGLNVKAEGSVTHAPITTDWHVQGVGDFNGDGNSDVLWRQDGSGQVYVWEMVGQQVQAEGAVAHAPVTSDWHVESVNDFNGDGNSDVLWRQDGSGQVYVWEMNGQQVQAEGAVAHAPVTSDWHVFSDLNFI